MDKYFTDKLTTIHKTRQKQKRPDKIKQTRTTWTTTVQHSQNTGANTDLGCFTRDPFITTPKNKTTQERRQAPKPGRT